MLDESQNFKPKNVPLTGSNQCPVFAATGFSSSIGNDELPPKNGPTDDFGSKIQVFDPLRLIG